jgi:ectoine hydroxylase-related dioxygenase (phytanoyl-CoA dioxygenase family)
LRLRAHTPSDQSRDAPRFADPWPLSTGGLTEVDRRLAAGRITETEAARLRDFAREGYVVLEGAISAELIDALVADVRKIGEHPGAFLTTAHRRAQAYRLSDPEFDAYESIFDTYVNLESARRVCFHPAIVRLIGLIFDERPLAFQQLLFQRSNGHQLHQDTAVVCVDEPQLLVATWIALEDVVPGRGELTYWEGSHRIAPKVFADGTRRFNPSRDDETALRDHLQKEIDRLGCPKRDFFAKKGDVLIWAADLIHASNPRTRPEEETRLSLVTHYCPESVRPFWMRLLPAHRHLQPVDDVGFIASQYYELPVTGLGRPRSP